MYRIVHISDIHFGRVRSNLAERLTATIHALHPHAVVVTGDITQRARSAQFRDASAFLAELPKPLIIAPGNHDVPLYKLHRRFLSPLRGYTKHVLPVGAGRNAHEAALIVAVDSTRSFTIDGGRVSTAEFARAKTAFEEAPATAIRIAALHHPVLVPNDVSSQKRLQNADQALRAFAAMGVDVILSGHTHRPFVTLADVPGASEPMRVLTVTAGSAISGRDRDWGNSFYALELIGDQLRVIEFRYSTELGKFAAAQAATFTRHKLGVWSRVNSV
jgi:3',5'-cyclic AMP phosphodiesterase CpdA